MFKTATGSGAAARRQRNRAEMQASILEASQTVIVEHGVEALTIRRIANALGYSPAAIYEYFDSKDSIIKALFFEGQGGLKDALEAELERLPPDTNVLDTIRALTRHYRELALENSEMYQLVFGGTQCPPPDQLLADFGHELGGLGIVMRLTQKAVDENLFAGVDAVTATLGIWSTAHGLVHLELTDHLGLLDWIDGDGTPPEPEQVAEARTTRYNTVILSMLRGMATDKGRELLND